MAQAAAMLRAFLWSVRWGILQIMKDEIKAYILKRQESNFDVNLILPSKAVANKSFPSALTNTYSTIPGTYLIRPNFTKK